MEIQDYDIKLVECITLLHANRDTLIVKTMLTLFDEIINKARRENDEATDNFLVLNQGKIAGMKQIKEYITKGLPKGIVQ